jgi:hypothetical protein
MKYQPALSIGCDLNQTTMGEAARKCGPSFTYDLHVHERDVFWVRQMLKKLGAATEDNPFAPYANLQIDNELLTYEWYISANGLSFGSRGPA